MLVGDEEKGTTGTFSERMQMAESEAQAVGLGLEHQGDEQNFIDKHLQVYKDKMGGEQVPEYELNLDLETIANEYENNPQTAFKMLNLSLPSQEAFSYNGNGYNAMFNETASLGGMTT